MLTYELSRQGAGIRLWGDYASLRRLHEVIHRLNEESRIIEDKEGFVLALAYDIRKATDRQRSIRDKPTYTDEAVPQFGVEIIWPILLLQAATLRYAMTYLPTRSNEHAAMFDLESVIESALHEATPATADDIVHVTQQAVLSGEPAISLKLDSRCIYFLKLNKRQRLAALLPVMRSFASWYDLLQDAQHLPPGTIHPSEFEACHGEDWPDFKW